MTAAILISIILILLTICLHQFSFVWLARIIPIGANSTHPGLFLLLFARSAAFIFAVMGKSWHCFSGAADIDRNRKKHTKE